MGRELRRHPRVPANRCCMLRNRPGDEPMRATAFSVASHGVGIKLNQLEASEIVVGAAVTIEIPLDGEVTAVVGSVAWIRVSPKHVCTMGIEFGLNGEIPPRPYQQWVEEQFAALREESYSLGGSLVEDRLIEPRTLDKALETQARDGGDLCDHLPQLDFVKASS